MKTHQPISENLATMHRTPFHQILLDRSLAESRPTKLDHSEHLGSLFIALEKFIIRKGKQNRFFQFTFEPRLVDVDDRREEGMALSRNSIGRARNFFLIF